MTFYVTPDNQITYGTAPDGATVIDTAGPYPFWNRAVTVPALAEILRLHLAWRRGENGGRRANLSGANLSGADLAGANLSGATGIASAESEAATWSAVRAAVLADVTRFDMSGWHGDEWDPDQPGACGTTHCLAGWAQALSTDPEIRRMDAARAGTMLLPRHAHLFYRPTDEVLAILRAEVAPTLETR